MARDVGEGLPKARTTARDQSRISRRGFLGKTAELGVKAGIVATVGQWAGRQAYEDEQAVANKTDKALDRVGSFFKREKGEQQGVSVEVHEKSEQANLVSPEFRAVFPNLIETERAKALQEVRQSKGLMLNKLDNKTIEGIATNGGLVRESAASVNMPENMASLLIGLVIAESNGDPNAISPKGAKGLTQMDDNMAQKYGLTISNGADDDRFIPEKILPATAQELNAQYGRYGNWGFAFWSWHLGDPQLYEALQIYFREQYKEELPSTYVEPADESPQAQAVATVEAQRRINLYKEMIQKKEITVYHVLSNPVITQHFGGEEWDKTGRYVYNVVAASEAFREEKAKLGIG